jgi:hypothetical protein
VRLRTPRAARAFPFFVGLAEAVDLAGSARLPAGCRPLACGPRSPLPLPPFVASPFCYAGRSSRFAVFIFAFGLAVAVDLAEAVDLPAEARLPAGRLFLGGRPLTPFGLAIFRSTSATACASEALNTETLAGRDAMTGSGASSSPAVPLAAPAVSLAALAVFLTAPDFPLGTSTAPLSSPAVPLSSPAVPMKAPAVPLAPR